MYALWPARGRKAQQHRYQLTGGQLETCVLRFALCAVRFSSSDWLCNQTTLGRRPSLEVSAFSFRAQFKFFQIRTHGKLNGTDVSSLTAHLRLRLRWKPNGTDNSSLTTGLRLRVRWKLNATDISSPTASLRLVLSAGPRKAGARRLQNRKAS